MFESPWIYFGMSIKGFVHIADLLVIRYADTVLGMTIATYPMILYPNVRILMPIILQLHRL